MEMRAALVRGDLSMFCDALHRSWLQERRAGAHAYDPLLGKGYQLARKNGTLGGKVVGTGDGLLLLYCPLERQDAVTESLAELGLQRRFFAPEDHGVQILQAIPWEGPMGAPRAFFRQQSVMLGTG